MSYIFLVVYSVLLILYVLQIDFFSRNLTFVLFKDRKNILRIIPILALAKKKVL